MTVIDKNIANALRVSRGLSGVEEASGLAQQAEVVAPQQAAEAAGIDPVTVDAQTKQASRAVANAAAGGMQAALNEQMAVQQQTIPGFEQLLGALFGNDPALLKQLLTQALNALGYDIKDLDSLAGHRAIADLKGQMGFPPNAMIDMDLLMSILMAQAGRDRGYSTGAGGTSGGRGRNTARNPRTNGTPLGKTKPVDTSNWKPGKGDVTPDQLTQIASSSGHKLSAERAAQVAPHVNRAMAEANIDTPQKKSAFIAQLMHESGGFKYNEEIASGGAYEGRADLGNTQPGDGQRFKGRGFIQLTGRANYEAAGKALGLDLVNHPELAAKDENAARVAAWYWNSRGLNEKAERGDFDGITKSINGGFNGKADRDRLYANASNVLRDSRGLPSTGEFIEQNATTSGATTSAAVRATDGMSDAQKYDHYKAMIEQSGGTLDETPGKRHVVGVRDEDQSKNAYDDRMAVIWRDDAGNPQVREFTANMESTLSNRGRYGRDMDGDGVRDTASLVSGNHVFSKSHSDRLGRVLRPANTTAVLRDTDADGRGDALDRTGAGQSILFHQGGYNSVGSAGCQTMPPDEFERFWNTLGSQTRFNYTLVDTQ